MHWELRQARTFVAVAEALSFSEAARRLNTSQSAVSRTVGQMEADLRVPLLSRTTRSVALTAEGRLLLDECREVLAHFERWVGRARRVASGLAGEIRVGVNDFASQAEFPRLLCGFRRLYPEITFRIMSGTRQRQLSALETGEIDIGFAMGPLGDVRYRSFRTGEYGLNALMHRTHPLSNRPVLTLGDLAEQPLILGSRPTWLTFHEYLDRIFGTAGVPLKIAQEIEESVAIFGLIVASGGVTLYPDCQRHLSLTDVVAIPIIDVSEPVETIAIWASPPLPQAARVFLDFVLEESP